MAEAGAFFVAGLAKTANKATASGCTRPRKFCTLFFCLFRSCEIAVAVGQANESLVNVTRHRSVVFYLVACRRFRRSTRQLGLLELRIVPLRRVRFLRLRE